MIEIDGEFFEDPCELRKQERIVAIMEALVDTLSAQLKAETDSAPEIVLQVLRDLGYSRMAMIRMQPLWPPSFATGGIVPDSRIHDKRYRLSVGDKLTQEMIINVDPATPGLDRCFLGGVEI